MYAQIFFESVTWEIVGLGETIGFTHPPGGEDFKNRSQKNYSSTWERGFQKQVTQKLLVHHFKNRSQKMTHPPGGEDF